MTTQDLTLLSVTTDGCTKITYTYTAADGTAMTATLSASSTNLNELAIEAHFERDRAQRRLDVLNQAFEEAAA